MKDQFGLIGCNHGASYVRFCEGHGRLSAIADINPQALQEMGECLDVPHEQQYETWEALLFRAACSAIIVATPGTVREPVRVALALGRNVFCENPLAVTADDAKVICDLYHEERARRREQVLTVNEQWLWLPGVQKAAEMVKSDMLGELQEISISGKGREFETELVRIGSHLLSVAIHHFTGPVLSARMARGVVICETEAGIPLHADFISYRDEGDVRRCSLKLLGSKGQLLLRGGFLETIWHLPYTDGVPEMYWQEVSMGDHIWPIQRGEEGQALCDPFMNPTYWLLGRFLAAMHGKAENPYPPDKFLPVAYAMDIIRHAALS